MADTPEISAVPAPEVNTVPAPEVNTVPAPAVAIPEQYRPLSPWAYFGLSLLYSIPIVGFIFLIIFSFKSSNINRRNFTRSYWCGLIIAAVIFIVVLVIGIATGALMRYSY